jgi:N-acetylglucosaminyl-diphospho-decaprenol L-rhamnosyltransferase
MDAITVTCNSGRDLRNLLTCEPLRAAFDRLFVVDAFSGDGSGDMAREHGATVIRMEQPTGYGACVNRAAALTQGDRFAVLNPDILFEDPAVPTRLADGTLQDSARQVPTPADLLMRRRSSRQYGVIRASGLVPWVVGAFMVINRDAFGVVGGFDERYFLYFEDVDLCWRMRRAGFGTYFDAATEVRHEHQAGSHAPIWSRSTRAHVRSALRFYSRYPRFVVSRHARA